METRLVYTLALAVIGLFAVGLAVGILRRKRHFGGARIFALLIACGAIYTFGYLAELWSGGSLSALLLCTRLEYLGISFIPPLWFLFCLDYTGTRVGRATRAIPLALGCLLLITVFTLRLHGLYYVAPFIDRGGPFPSLRFGRGPLYWAGQVYEWSFLLGGDLVLLRFAARAPRAFRGQILLVLSISALPLLVEALYLLGLFPLGLDPNPFGFTFGFGLAALSIFRFRLFDIAPIAREKVLESLEDGVLVLDTAGRLVDSNPAARQMLGMPELGEGQAFSDAASSFPELLSFAAQPPPGSAEFGIAGPGEEERRYRLRSFPIRSGDSDLGAAILLTDVSEAAALLSRLNELACTDEMTSLLNRRRFFEVGQREVDLARRAGRALSVCIADLDYFKAVNDSHGHAAGDAVLRAVAARFSGGLRSTDLLCRYGGEEFAFLFPDTEAEAAASVLERVRLAVSGSPVGWEGLAIAVTSSFGIWGGVPEEEEDLDFFLRRADLALYEAKAAGRNLVRIWEGKGEA